MSPYAAKSERSKNYEKQIHCKYHNEHIIIIFVCNSIEFETKSFVKDPELNAAYKRGKAVDRDASPWKIAVVEPSEELRLLQTKLVSLLQHRLCRLGSQAQLLPYFHDKK